MNRLKTASPRAKPGLTAHQQPSAKKPAAQHDNQKKVASAKMGRIVQRYQGK